MPFAIFQAIRVAVLIVQVLKVKNVEDVGLWVYLSKSFGIVNDLVGYGCLIGIIYTLHKNHTKVSDEINMGMLHTVCIGSVPRDLSAKLNPSALIF